jgi:hypothetical protein
MLTLFFCGGLIGSPLTQSRRLGQKIILPLYKYSQNAAISINRKMAPQIVFGKISMRGFKLYLWGILLLALLVFYVRSKFAGPKKYFIRGGYVVIETGELEHRWLAEKYLGRSLYENEIVHHINGQPSDNSLANLCVMNSEKHELFHTWLRWSKEKKGRYPPISDQRRVLQTEYNGILF